MTNGNHNGRTFKPVILENRILAGGMTIAEVDDEGRVIFEDSFGERRRTRGTACVSIDVLELLEALLAHYRRAEW